jgi:hypothetical protein
MATLTSTGITFSDSTSLASAAPTVSQVGGIVNACYIVTTPTAGNNVTAQNYYPTGTTVAGSSLAYDVRFPAQITGTTNAGMGAGFSRVYHPGSISSIAFPPTGAIGASYYPMIRQFGGSYSGAINASLSYSTLGGSWRSLSTVPVNMSNSSCGSEGTWSMALWQRYA